MTQANIRSTICAEGWADTVRPPQSVSEPEKEASLAAYGQAGPLHAFEYDHLVPLELGGASNDQRNLWPQPGASPNPKDTVEDGLNQQVCDGEMTLARAQRAIAANWVRLGRAGTPTPGRRPPHRRASAPPAGGATCSANAQYNGRYDDYDVLVQSNQPDQTVIVSGGGESRTWHTDSSGYADVYFHAGRSAAGERISVRVGTSNCWATL